MPTTTKRKKTEVESFRAFTCARCFKPVLICSDCDRGNIYCSEGCAQIRRRESIRRASKKYQNSIEGKLNHADRQNRYRARKKKVTHQGSHSHSFKDILCQILKMIWLISGELQKKRTDFPRSTTRERGNHCDFCGCKSSGYVRFYFTGSKEVPD